jgi:rhamnosyl/mannosyltransferase
VTSAALALALRRARPQALVTVQWTDAILAARLARTSAATIVVWAALGDAADAVRADLRIGRLRRRLLRTVRHVVLTEAMAAELERLQLPRPDVIPIPIDRAHFRPPSAAERAASRRAFSLEDEFGVLYVGHLRALKRVDALVEAFASFAQERAARLLLVGGNRGADDDVEAALRAQVARLELEGRVVFAGVRSDPREAYWAADAFVLPSTREGLPNTLVEALACGLPSIAPKSAAGDSVLADGAGIVTETNSPANLLAALRELAGDGARRAALAASGPTHAKRYDVEAVVDAYERLIGELA